MAELMFQRVYSPDTSIYPVTEPRDEAAIDQDNRRVAYNTLRSAREAGEIQTAQEMLGVIAFSEAHE